MLAREFRAFVERTRDGAQKNDDAQLELVLNSVDEGLHRLRQGLGKFAAYGIADILTANPGFKVFGKIPLVQPLLSVPAELEFIEAIDLQVCNPVFLDQLHRFVEKYVSRSLQVASLFALPRGLHLISAGKTWKRDTAPHFRPSRRFGCLLIDLGSICEGGKVTLYAEHEQISVFGSSMPFVAQYLGFFDGRGVALQHEAVRSGVQSLLEFDLCLPDNVSIVNPLLGGGILCEKLMALLANNFSVIPLESKYNVMQDEVELVGFDAVLSHAFSTYGSGNQVVLLCVLLEREYEIGEKEDDEDFRERMREKRREDYDDYDDYGWGRGRRYYDDYDDDDDFDSSEKEIEWSKSHSVFLAIETVNLYPREATDLCDLKLRVDLFDILKANHKFVSANRVLVGSGDDDDYDGEDGGDLRRWQDYRSHCFVVTTLEELSKRFLHNIEERLLFFRDRWNEPWARKQALALCLSSVDECDSEDDMLDDPNAHATILEFLAHMREWDMFFELVGPQDHVERYFGVVPKEKLASLARCADGHKLLRVASVCEAAADILMHSAQSGPACLRLARRLARVKNADFSKHISVLFDRVASKFVSLDIAEKFFEQSIGFENARTLFASNLSMLKLDSVLASLHVAELIKRHIGRAPMNLYEKVSANAGIDLLERIVNVWGRESASGLMSVARVVSGPVTEMIKALQILPKYGISVVSIGEAILRADSVHFEVLSVSKAFASSGLTKMIPSLVSKTIRENSFSSVASLVSSLHLASNEHEHCSLACVSSPKFFSCLSVEIPPCFIIQAHLRGELSRLESEMQRERAKQKVPSSPKHLYLPQVKAAIEKNFCKVDFPGTIHMAKKTAAEINQLFGAQVVCTAGTSSGSRQLTFKSLLGAIGMQINELAKKIEHIKKVLSHMEEQAKKRPRELIVY